MTHAPSDARDASRRSTRFFVRVAAVLLAWSSSGAQTPARPTNLQVLPAQITPDSLINVMGGFTRALGVRCAYCHVAKNGVRPTAEEFASDDRETKRVARAMLRDAPIVLLDEAADAISLSAASVELGVGGSFSQTVLLSGARLQRRRPRLEGETR